MIKLTDEQQAAVDHVGNLLLTACPGSGKTRTLIAKLVSSIDTIRGSSRKVGCITYTNTAVQEIELRSREQLQPGDEAYYNVSTIHSFCLSEIIRPFAWLLPHFNGAARILTRDNPDFDLICSRAAAQINMLQLTPADLEAFENLTLNSRGQIVGLASRNTPVSQAAPHFWRICSEMGYIDFGSIIFDSYQLLAQNSHIAESLCARYRWLLVDEFQDTSELQIEILLLLYKAGRSTFFAVGDLAQSIFAFAGSRPELVKPFGLSIGARQDLTLSENFRSSEHIVTQAERLFPRSPAMTAVGKHRLWPTVPFLVKGVPSAFHAITEFFLPALEASGIELGEATVLAKDWFSLISLARRLRTFGTPIVGPGARPYRRSRLFAQLAEQLCGAITDPGPEINYQIERALFHAIQDVTGLRRLEVFSHIGRVVLIRLLREAARLAELNRGAVQWLDNMAQFTGETLYRTGFVDSVQAGLFYSSVQEMKIDMRRQEIDAANLSIQDLGLFASPTRALRLSTLHYSKGREYDAVAMIGLRHGSFPHFKADDIDAEKRLFYVGVTRARKLLMYVSEAEWWGNPPSVFLGSSGVDVK